MTDGGKWRLRGGFEELLGFETHFMVPSSIVRLEKDGVMQTGFSRMMNVSLA